MPWIKAFLFALTFLATQPALASYADYSTYCRYCLHGNLLSETDRRNHTTTYAYDPVNRRIREEAPLGRTLTRAYDGNGNVAREVERKEIRDRHKLRVFSRQNQRFPDFRAGMAG